MHSTQKTVMAIDVGTESVRVGLFDRHGALVAMAVEPSQTHFPRPGWAEQNPADWWKALKLVSRQCLSQAGISPAQVAGLAVDATSATVLAVDDRGEPLTPAIMWMDSRAIQETADIARSSHPVLRYSGGQDAVEWMTPKALWLKRMRPQVYQQAAYIVDALDWLNFKLTGEWVASICNVTCKANYVTDLNGWSPEFFAEIGLEDILGKWPSRVLPLGQLVGPLTPAAAAELGLPAGIPVGQGGVDAHVGMLGMGVVEAGALSLTMGSSGVHLGLVAEPVFHKGMWGPYPEAVIPGLYVIEGGQISTGSITKWFKEQLAGPEVERAQAAGSNPYELLAEAAEKIPAGAEGLLALDFWQGNRTPYRDPYVRGALIGLTFAHTRAHIYRAILEAVAYGTRNILETFKEVGRPFERIIVGGGGAKNRMWLQIHADICHQELITTRFSDTSLLGSAVCAAMAAGWYDALPAAAHAMTGIAETIRPNPANYSRYDFLFKKYQQAYEGLKDIMRDITLSAEVN
jgi:FGGY-family pentulose kinase